MITIATLKDEMVDGQRRAAGRKIRRAFVVCVDKYNISLILYTDSSTKVGEPFALHPRGAGQFIGQKYVGKFAHLGHVLKKYDGLDEESARCEIIKFFAKFSGTEVGNLSWTEMDERFKVSKRKPRSTGELVLYERLKDQGWKDAGNA